MVRSIVVGIFQVMRLHHIRALSQKSETDPSVVVVSIVSTVRGRFLLSVDTCGCHFESQTSGYQGSFGFPT